MQFSRCMIRLQNKAVEKQGISKRTGIRLIIYRPLLSQIVEGCDGSDVQLIMSFLPRQ